MRYFQDPVTPVMEGIIELHDYIFFYLIIVLIFTLVMYINIIHDFFYVINNPLNKTDAFTYRNLLFGFRNFTHHTNLEVIWTFIPSVILLLIAVPSFAMLYSMDEVLAPFLTFKAIGHQWYWNYEISDYGWEVTTINYDDNGNTINEITEFIPYTISIDSNMVPSDDLSNHELRLLETDNSLILPENVHLRGLTTSMDVLHSWAIPSFGIKMDAIPGRLNQIGIFAQRTGAFYGQCSELCGVNHGFMPISIRVVSMTEFNAWINSQLDADLETLNKALS
jgi:cytochrome c oxidase subunit 2